MFLDAAFSTGGGQEHRTKVVFMSYCIVTIVSLDGDSFFDVVVVVIMTDVCVVFSKTVYHQGLSSNPG